MSRIREKLFDETRALMAKTGANNCAQHDAATERSKLAPTGPVSVGVSPAAASNTLIGLHCVGVLPSSDTGSGR
jgi:hypothetical protein